MRVNNKKGVALSLLLTLFIAVIFWTQSRFPALDEKAQMGQRTSISSMAFDVLYPLSAEQSHVERICYSSINWAYTNWKGMTFGLLLSASILTLLSFISFRARRSEREGIAAHIANAFKGALLGFPMGVCANCSTPIAFGMYRGGTPVAMALAMLSSSPSFNVVVLTMSLTLLPLELVIIKYLMVCLFIFVFVPILLSRGLALGKSNLELSPASDGLSCLAETPTLSVASFLRRYSDKLLFVLRGTLPFMLLAGVLAATVAEFVSLDALSGAWSFPLLCLVAICAAFFPVPIAFDVVISLGLLAAGVDIVYVAAVFLGLGVFSIYPAMIIARDISLRLSLAMLLGLVGLSILAGVLTEAAFKYRQQTQFSIINQADEQYQALASAENAMPVFEARALVRKAARLCHRLGESRQYDCYERFVVENLSQQFPVQACDYLEDANEYRRRCNDAYLFLDTTERARELQEIQLCAALASRYRTLCEYDVVFEQTTIKQSILPCLNLENNASRSRCLRESMALNLELYQQEKPCEVLVDQQLQARCLAEFDELKVMHQSSYQNDITACEGGSELATRECQRILLINRLAEGADQDYCQQLPGLELQQECRQFRNYFQVLDSADSDACITKVHPSLLTNCEDESIQVALSRQMTHLRFKYLEKLTGLSSILSENSAIKAKDVAVVDLNETRHAETKTPLASSVETRLFSDQGRIYRLKETPLRAKSDSLFSGLKSQKQGDEGFNQVSALELGLLPVPALRYTELFEPFSYGRGIASSDINKDIWPDLVMAYRDRVRVYRNQQGRFTLSDELLFGEEMSPVLVCFVDIDHDGWQDLFVSFYGADTRIYWNEKGRFDAQDYQALALERSQLVMSAAFQDMDRDGDLDMVLGGWTAGDLRHFNPHRSQNYYVENSAIDSFAVTNTSGDGEAGEVVEANNSDRRSFHVHALQGVQGETLSVLLSDLDHNGRSELFVGNDMDAPDAIYQWGEDGFELAKQSQALPTLSSFNTMSITSGDLNRDLRLDYFSADMSFGGDEGQSYCEQTGIADKTKCLRLLSAQSALHLGKAGWCESLEGLERKNCFQAHLLQLAKQSGEPAYCQRLAAESEALFNLCLAASSPLPPKPKLSYSKYPQGVQRNMLMLSSPQGFEDKTLAWSAEDSYWSWNASIADLDNDAWQDIYIGNGYSFGGSGRHLHSNVFLHNKAGKGFESAAQKYGLSDYLNTPSFVLIDFDLDGDLDIISQRVAANHGVFINNTSKLGLRVTLRDMSFNGEQLALGASISLDPGKDSAQLVELKLGGGFLSYNEVVAHFGLGLNKEAVEQLAVRWPDGRSDTLSYAFKPGHHYQLSLLARSWAGVSQ